MKQVAQCTYGHLSGAAIGIIIKEIAQRALLAIRTRRFNHAAQEKKNPGKEYDVVTDADFAAQEMYIKLIRECLPGFGIIAEEHGLRCEPAKGCTLWVTVDPLDGTKAFARGQSSGVGSMLSVVKDDEVIAAIIGDVMTGELYYFRPEGSAVHRLDRFAHLHQQLEPKPVALKKMMVMLEDPHNVYSQSDEVGSLVNRFKGSKIDGGSIGLRFARLWTNEIGALILKRTECKPWDFAPIYGISKRLGYEIYYICFNSPIAPLIPLRITKRELTGSWYPEREMIVTHPDTRAQLLEEMGVGVKRKRRK
jgi:fructose-1,6-bisphosphatase/inositol monophosphatase family enzyme